MSWLICGMSPEAGPLSGAIQVKLDAGAALRPSATETPSGGALLQIGGARLPIRSGLSALAAAAAIAAAELGAPAPELLLSGGHNAGERLYEALLERIAAGSLRGITVHSLELAAPQHKLLLRVLKNARPRPLLCAQGVSGPAAAYDLCMATPGQLASLPAGEAPAAQCGIEARVAAAFAQGRLPAALLFLDGVDLFIHNGKPLERVDYPGLPTPDAADRPEVTAGVASALLAAGYPMPAACRLAALSGRFMLQLAQPEAGTPAAELLAQLPEGLRLALRE